MGGRASYYYNLTKNDLDNIMEAAEVNDIHNVQREYFENWLYTHSGDFQSIIDYKVDVKDIIYDWKLDDSEQYFCDCMFPEYELC